MPCRARDITQIVREPEHEGGPEAGSRTGKKRRRLSGRLHTGRPDVVPASFFSFLRRGCFRAQDWRKENRQVLAFGIAGLWGQVRPDGYGHRLLPGAFTRMRFRPRLSTWPWRIPPETEVAPALLGGDDPLLFSGRRDAMKKYIHDRWDHFLHVQFCCFLPQHQLLTVEEAETHAVE